MSDSILIFYGSYRSDRQGIRLAEYLVGAFGARGARAELIDAKALDLPMLDRMYKEYPKGEAREPLERLATLFRGADAFVVVSAEYNHSIPPALSNTLDHFLEEYFWRPSAICCYSAGQYGGVRAAMQLRAMLAELGTPSIPSLLPIPRIQKALSEAGEPAEDWLGRAAKKFLDELTWYAEALKAKRAGGTPY